MIATWYLYGLEIGAKVLREAMKTGQAGFVGVDLQLLGLLKLLVDTEGLRKWRI